MDPWGIPLLGSCILLASGFVLTLGHHGFFLGNKDLVLVSMFFTVLLGALFLFLQFNEYYYSTFTLSDSVFGSVFYMTTGLHALHVIIGVLFLTVCMIRVYFDSFTSEHALGLDFAIYYWHLVDVVWLLVFLVFYYWGGDSDPILVLYVLCFLEALFFYLFPGSTEPNGGGNPPPMVSLIGFAHTAVNRLPPAACIAWAKAPAGLYAGQGPSGWNRFNVPLRSTLCRPYRASIATLRVFNPSLRYMAFTINGFTNILYRLHRASVSLHYISLPRAHMGLFIGAPAPWPTFKSPETWSKDR